MAGSWLREVQLTLGLTHGAFQDIVYLVPGMIVFPGSRTRCQLHQEHDTLLAIQPLQIRSEQHGALQGLLLSVQGSASECRQCDSHCQGHCEHDSRSLHRLLLHELERSVYPSCTTVLTAFLRPSPPCLPVASSLSVVYLHLA